MDKQMQIKIAALALAVILIVAIISLFAGGGELLAYASNDGMVVANSKSGKVIVKAKDTNADSPVITANKRYVVYKSGFTLYALRTKGGAKAVKLVDTVGSFTVSQNGSTVYYAPYQGQGIFSIRIGKDKKPVTEIKPSGFIVQNMHFAGNLLCAEKYIKDNVTGKLTEASISGYNLKQKNEKILVPFKAATASDPGVAPKIIGVTADRRRIYFFDYPEF
ncbi:MAG: hypothetical protein Q8865_02810 [Bacillota bacterium]|nr:hypothetical protein [Bacillota bacterium]